MPLTNRHAVARIEEGVPLGVGTLGADGLPPLNERPPAIKNFSANSEAAMLAETGLSIGSRCVRTDVGHNFDLENLPSSVIGNWIERGSVAGVASIISGDTYIDVTGGDDRVVNANVGETAGTLADGAAPGAARLAAQAFSSEFTNNAIEAARGNSKDYRWFGASEFYPKPGSALTRSRFTDTEVDYIAMPTGSDSQASKIVEPPRGWTLGANVYIVGAKGTSQEGDFVLGIGSFSDPANQLGDGDVVVPASPHLYQTFTVPNGGATSNQRQLVACQVGANQLFESGIDAKGLNLIIDRISNPTTLTSIGHVETYHQTWSWFGVILENAASV